MNNTLQYIASASTDQEFIDRLSYAQLPVRIKNNIHRHIWEIKGSPQNVPFFGKRAIETSIEMTTTLYNKQKAVEKTVILLAEQSHDVAVKQLAALTQELRKPESNYHSFFHPLSLNESTMIYYRTWSVLKPTAEQDFPNFGEFTFHNQLSNTSRAKIIEWILLNRLNLLSLHSVIEHLEKQDQTQAILELNNVPLNVKNKIFGVLYEEMNVNSQIQNFAEKVFYNIERDKAPTLEEKKSAIQKELQRFEDHASNLQRKWATITTSPSLEELRKVTQFIEKNRDNSKSSAHQFITPSQECSAPVLLTDAGKIGNAYIRIRNLSSGFFKEVDEVLDYDSLEPYVLKKPKTGEGKYEIDKEITFINFNILNSIGIINAIGIIKVIWACDSLILEEKGECLQDRLSSLQDRDIKQIASDVTKGLEYLHSKNIVHKDIKPANILLKNGNRACLTDFGTNSFKTIENCSIKSLSGTIIYFPPEVFKVWKDQKNYEESLFKFWSNDPSKGIVQGKRADIFSLGIVFYQLYNKGLTPPWFQNIKASCEGKEEINIAKIGYAEITDSSQISSFKHLYKFMLNHDFSKRPYAREINEILDSINVNQT